jgi:KaiC/GvpD/RAD55 family RecA-like ATPase
MENNNAPINAKALLALNLQPPKFIISQILPPGLSILSGSPKVGKSWLALWMCHQISCGESVWEFETQKSAVLYLSLEDTLYRLSERLSHITDNPSENSYFDTNSDDISDELINRIKKFVHSTPQAKLIIIDTLQKIRNTASCYAFDYKEMNKIKSVADELKIAIMLVHHTRKSPASDPFKTISGSTGLTGSCDTMFVLEKSKRVEDEAVLHITGRDVEDMQIKLMFNRERKVWDFLSFGCNNENPTKNLIEAVIDLIAERKTFSGTASELITALNTVDESITVKPNIISRILNEHICFFEKHHKIKVEFNRTNYTRTITLSVSDDEPEIVPQSKQSSPSPKNRKRENDTDDFEQLNLGDEEKGFQ